MTHRSLSPGAASLVLSTFTGAGLFDRGFREAGFCVVSAGDAQFGQRIEEFHALAGVFGGVIGGPPCQKFSGANRTNRDVAAGMNLVREFFRVVSEALPDWFLMENVNGVPDVSELAPLGYSVQRLNLNARELGFAQNRPRKFFFGYAHGEPLSIPYVTELKETAAGSSRCCIASEGAHGEGRRAWPDFCALQGLPREFTFPPGLSLALQYRLVGNGVHVGVAKILARAIIDRPQGSFALKTPPSRRLCVCECGREVRAGVLHATASCRKRMERRRNAERDAAGENSRGPVTEELFA